MPFYFGEVRPKAEPNQNKMAKSGEALLNSRAVTKNVKKRPNKTLEMHKVASNFIVSKHIYLGSLAYHMIFFWLEELYKPVSQFIFAPIKSG